MEGIALELWGWTRGSTRAAGRGWGLQGHQGSVLPSLPEQTYPADPSQVSWATAWPSPGTMGPSQEGIPWEGMGIGLGQCPAQWGPGPGKDRAAASVLHIKEALITK